MSLLKLSDKQVEEFIGQVLRAGVLLSSAVTVIGICLYLAHHHSAIPAYGVFHSSNGTLLPGFVGKALHGNAIAIIQLGILLLIATPVARVFFLVLAFALERDKMYVAVSALVLFILLYSLFFMG